MKTDTQLNSEGFHLLFENLGVVDAERFIALVQREKFDYTQWQRHLFDELSVEELSRRAMEYVKTNEEPVGKVY